MREVGVRELKQQASDLLRRVREDKETIAVTYRGRVIARIVPLENERSTSAEALGVWAEMDELAREIGERWSEGTSALEAVQEQRREL